MKYTFDNGVELDAELYFEVGPYLVVKKQEKWDDKHTKDRFFLIVRVDDETSFFRCFEICQDEISAAYGNNNIIRLHEHFLNEREVTPRRLFEHKLVASDRVEDFEFIRRDVAWMCDISPWKVSDNRMVGECKLYIPWAGKNLVIKRHNLGVFEDYRYCDAEFEGETDPQYKCRLDDDIFLPTLKEKAFLTKEDLEDYFWRVRENYWKHQLIASEQAKMLLRLSYDLNGEFPGRFEYEDNEGSGDDIVVSKVVDTKGPYVILKYGEDVVPDCFGVRSGNQTILMHASLNDLKTFFGDRTLYNEK